MNLTRKMLRAPWLMCALISTRTFAAPPPPLPHRVFATSRTTIDRVLARPYNAEVPFGATGDRVWATSPQGWAFASGVQLLYLTNLNAFDVRVTGGEQSYVVGKADYFPSHVHSVGKPGTSLTASASFTYQTDQTDNPLTAPFTPAKRWTCWSSKQREDWWGADFGRTRKLWGASLYFYDDGAQGGGCAPPESVRVEAYRDGQWHPVATRPIVPTAGRTNIAFLGIAPESMEQIRFTFRNRGADKYTGLYGFQPAYAAGFTPPRSSPLRVMGDKWITSDDVLVSCLTLQNVSNAPQPFSIAMQSPLTHDAQGIADQHDVDGNLLQLRGAGWDGKTADSHFAGILKTGETRTFTFALGADTDAARAGANMARRLRDPHGLQTQIAQYQGWYDRNTAHFACADPLVTKMYAHRWYNVRKNAMNPCLGVLQHRAFAEGRWTSDWYANVISYGAGHQIRESRWLRDPSYTWGALQTWTENERPDGLYPSHITTKGQQGGKYTDWITSTAWDAYLVHPDKRILGGMADALIANVNGWRKVYGWNDSPLLVVDSHWWTGMEWQPSFFSFADYQTGGGGGEDARYMTPLRRVDLTAYEFGNAQNTARILRELGRIEDAARMQAIADETRRAVLKQMWNPKTQWFHSLRASDDALSPTKEVIGVYPFYFDLPTPGKGRKSYEAAWDVLLDSKQFWTRWPLASVSEDCPAFAQNGWPVGSGGSICMWNGPSWPHANSIVLQAMANTLRNHPYRTALTRQRLLDLFTSFTRVQYYHQNPRLPWTGEYYNGDTGVWKTTQRDYNHSTWIDPLIADLIGLVPRADNTLEIDPLLPDDAWDYYVLDGQSYRGHDITIAWDAKGGRIAPDFRGYAIYVDGKPVFHAGKPVRFTCPLPGVPQQRATNGRHAILATDRNQPHGERRL